MFMLNRAGDLTDEEEEEKRKGNEIVILGHQLDKKEKKKLDQAASMIQKAWKKKSERIIEMKSKTKPYLKSQKVKKQKGKMSIYERRAKEREEENREKEIKYQSKFKRKRKAKQKKVEKKPRLDKDGKEIKPLTWGDEGKLKM